MSNNMSHHLKSWLQRGSSTPDNWQTYSCDICDGEFKSPTRTINLGSVLIRMCMQCVYQLADEKRAGHGVDIVFMLVSDCSHSMKLIWQYSTSRWVVIRQAIDPTFASTYVPTQSSVVRIITLYRQQREDRNE